MEDIQYSSFWLDPDVFSHLQVKRKRNQISTEYYIALISYKRAIANFVKIITGENIPVRFNDGKQSFATSSRIVTISSKISEGNIDVTVGLALHEAMHVKHSDFALLAETLKFYIHPDKFGEQNIRQRKELKYTINLLEDFRIDSIAYVNHVGYRGYYQKLYSYYLSKLIENKNDVIDRLRNDYTPHAYLAYLQILAYDSSFPNDLLIGINDILSLININTIHEKSASQLIDLSVDVYHLICTLCLENHVTIPQPKLSLNERLANRQPEVQKTEEDKDDLDQNYDNADDFGPEDTSQVADNEDTSDGASNKYDEDGCDVEDDEDDAPGTGMLEEIEEMEDVNNNNIDSLLEVSKQILESEIFDKVDLNISDSKTVNLFDSNAFLSSKDLYKNKPYLSIIFENVNPAQYVENLDSQLSSLIPSNVANRIPPENITKAISLGTILSSKLKIRNEVKTTLRSRKTQGKIFSSSLYLLASGDPRIFYKKESEYYNPSFIHLSIDASSSMRGEPWENSLILAITVAKAASLLKNVHVTISFKHASALSAINSVIYNSKIHRFAELITRLKYINPRSNTPEGLCYSSLSKYIKKVSSGYDVYIINISDGEPTCQLNNLDEYSGWAAMEHTKKSWNKMLDECQATGLSYFISSSPGNNSDFKYMYGSCARFINPDNIIDISKTINEMLLQNKSSYSS